MLLQVPFTSFREWLLQNTNIRNFFPKSYKAPQKMAHLRCIIPVLICEIQCKAFFGITNNHDLESGAKKLPGVTVTSNSTSALSCVGNTAYLFFILICFWSIKRSPVGVFRPQFWVNSAILRWRLSSRMGLVRVMPNLGNEARSRSSLWIPSAQRPKP